MKNPRKLPDVRKAGTPVATNQHPPTGSVGDSSPETGGAAGASPLSVPVTSDCPLTILTPQPQPMASPAFVLPDHTTPQVQGNVPPDTIGQIQTRLGITLTELAGFLRVAESTIHQYKQPSERITDPGMAEQLILLRSFAEQGHSIFQRPYGYQHWLRSPQRDLNDVSPVAFLSTRQGIVFVDEILSRLEHGLPA